MVNPYESPDVIACDNIITSPADVAGGVTVLHPAKILSHETADTPSSADNIINYIQIPNPQITFPKHPYTIIIIVC